MQLLDLRAHLDAQLGVEVRERLVEQERDRLADQRPAHRDPLALAAGELDGLAAEQVAELQQVADPQTLYDRPVNLFVGGFIGSPAMNMIEATLQRQNGGFAARVGDQTIAIESEEVKARPGLAAYDGKQVVLGIRPEDLEDAALAPGTERQRLHGNAQLTEALGSEIMVHFNIKARHAMTEDVRELAEDVGDDRALDQAEDEATLVGRFGARSRVRPGQAIDVAVDTRSLHFFDPQTGLGIYDGHATKGAE